MSYEQSLVLMSIEKMVDGFKKNKDLKLKNYWNYYYGNHNFNVANEDGFPLFGIGKKRIVKNYCKYVVDEAVSALFGNGINIEPYEENEEKREEIKEVLENVWCSRTGKRKLQQIGVMGSVTGDCYVKKYFDQETKQIVLNVLDTSWVTPIFEDNNNIDKITGIIIQYEFFDKNNKAVSYLEIITPEEIKVFYNKVLQPELSGKNKYGFLTVSRIKNQEIPNCYEGLSDIEMIYKLNDEINHLTSDLSTSLYYHGNPIFVVKNAGVKELALGANKTLNLPDEKSDAFYVKRDTDFESIRLQIEDLKKTLLKIARLPDEMKTDANISGVALFMLQAPLIKLVSQKQIFYGEGIEEMNEKILKMLEMEGQISNINNYLTEVCFPPYLPVDEAQQALTKKTAIDSYISLVNNNLITRETALSKMIEEGLLMIGEAEEELNKLEKEKKEETESIFNENFKDNSEDME